MCTQRISCQLFFNMRAIPAKLPRAPFPVRRDRVHSLRSAGAPALIGLSKRPVFVFQGHVSFLNLQIMYSPPSQSGGDMTVCLLTVSLSSSSTTGFDNPRSAGQPIHRGTLAPPLLVEGVRILRCAVRDRFTSQALFEVNIWPFFQR